MMMPRPLLLYGRRIRVRNQCYALSVIERPRHLPSRSASSPFSSFDGSRWSRRNLYPSECVSYPRRFSTASNPDTSQPLTNPESSSSSPSSDPQLKTEWRDYSSLGALTVLEAIRQLTSPTVSSLMRYLSGGILPQTHILSTSFSSSSPSKTKHPDAKTPYPPQYYRELLALLVQEGYVSETTRRSRKKDFTAVRYSLLDRGHQALRADVTSVLRLPVTAVLRQKDASSQQRRDRYVQQLQSSIALEQLQQLDMDTLRLHGQWMSCLASGDAARVQALEELQQVLLRWWAAEGLAPDDATITNESDSILWNIPLVKIAFHVATGLPGELISIKKLQSLVLGDSLVHRQQQYTMNEPVLRLQEQLTQWINQHQPLPRDLDAPMILDQVLEHPPWPYADGFSFSKPDSITRIKTTTSWEATYAAYQQQPGPAEDLERPRGASAMDVRLHLFDALIHGKAVHLEHIGVTPVPTRRDWLKLQQAACRLGIDVLDDPATSGPHGGPLSLFDFLRSILGDFILDIMPKERSEIDQAVIKDWCHRVRWYLALRRSGYAPQFVKPARLEEEEGVDALISKMYKSDSD